MSIVQEDVSILCADLCGASLYDTCVWNSVRVFTGLGYIRSIELLRSPTKKKNIIKPNRQHKTRNTHFDVVL